MNVELQYNPFTKEIENFLVDGKPNNLEDCWGDGKKPIEEWLSNFYSKLHYKFNMSSYHIVFRGIKSDFEKLEDAADDFKKENNITIELEHQGNGKNPEERLTELKSLFEKMQNEAPFKELKTEEMKKLFEKAVSSDFEMAVVATMSSGKSTLINAMLGQEILPARNEATTATIAHIHDVDGANVFSGKSYDADKNLLEECNPLTLENMDKLNSNPQTDVIEIYGDIEGISSRNLKLVLTDTPGPNNSRTETHKAHTFELIKADYKPMILYILNGTQLETNDDNSLLRDVAEAMNSGGRQAKDRFIFVLNKADEFDPEKGESVPKKIQDVKNYLARHGIKDAKVFPCASRMAKVIRQHLGNRKITETEEDDELPKYKSFIKREWKHFSDFTPLSDEMKAKQAEMIEKAKSNPDREAGEYQEALVYTGIPAVELAINEYLDKYALPAKVTEGVFSFKSRIDSLRLEADTTKKLKDDKNELQKRLELIEKITKQLENGKKKDDILKKIDSISVKNNFNEGYDSIYAETLGTFRDFSSNMSGSISLKDAEDRFNKVNSKLSEIQSKLKVNLERLLNKVLVVQVKSCVDDYKKYLSELIGDVNYESPAAVLGDLGDMSVENTLSEYKNEWDEQVEDGYHMEKNKGKKWYKFWTWFQPKEYKVIDFKTEHHTEIDFKKFLDEKVKPQFEASVRQMQESALGEASKQEKKFKDFFKSKISELDDKIKEKLEEQQSAFSDKEKFEKLINENERNLEWLKNFKTELDSVLDV